MRLILHLGAQGTDDGVIAAWMAENRAHFAANGLCAPAPDAFLQAISAALDDAKADPKTREESVLRGLGASGARRWLSVSAPGLLGAASDILTPEGFYVRDVARRLHGLGTLFSRCEVTLLLAIRSASGFLPAVLPDAPEALAERLSHLGGDTLPWAQLVRTIRRQIPQARLVVWRHEDFESQWPRILSLMAGPVTNAPPAGLLRIAARGLSAQAQLRLQRYCAANPPASFGHLRRVVESFGAHYGLSQPPNTEAPLPAWALREFARLDQGYATEWADIVGQTDVRALQATPAG